MLSNRESARRSRRRKQEQMNEFDTQVLVFVIVSRSLSCHSLILSVGKSFYISKVGQLRGEHSTLLSRLSNISVMQLLSTTEF